MKNDELSSLVILFIFLAPLWSFFWIIISKKRGIYFLSFLIFLVVSSIIFSIFIFAAFFDKVNKEENTTILINKAPQIFKEYSGLDIPSNVEVKYVSTRSFGPNGSTDIIFYLENINLFTEKVKKKYNLEDVKMNYPDIDITDDFLFGLNSDGNIFSDFCDKTNSDQKILQTKFKTLFKEIKFCGNKNAKIFLIKNEAEEVTILIILPNEKLVFLNQTYFF